MAVGGGSAANWDREGSAVGTRQCAANIYQMYDCVFRLNVYVPSLQNCHALAHVHPPHESRGGPPRGARARAPGFGRVGGRDLAQLQLPEYRIPLRSHFCVSLPSNLAHDLVQV